MKYLKYYLIILLLLFCFSPLSVHSTTHPQCVADQECLATVVAVSIRNSPYDSYVYQQTLSINGDCEMPSLATSSLEPELVSAGTDWYIVTIYKYYFYPGGWWKFGGFTGTQRTLVIPPGADFVQYTYEHMSEIAPNGCSDLPPPKDIGYGKNCSEDNPQYVGAP